EPALSPPSLPARPRPPKEAPRPTATLPSYLFEVAGNPERPTSPSMGTPVNEDAIGREYRALYVEFIKMRRTCREPIDNLDADRFVAALRQQRDQLSQKHANKEIRFRLAFDNGKAAIRFIVA
ncbi:MAG TPA: MXAN_5187 C-terminal domain-containing protein, partial [Polyangia bacterium]|nr:MXAN_5187 C-terminal domain-containing protein [Polyangia bacterium]